MKYEHANGQKSKRRRCKPFNKHMQQWQVQFHVQFTFTEGVVDVEGEKCMVDRKKTFPLMHGVVQGIDFHHGPLV